MRRKDSVCLNVLFKLNTKWYDYTVMKHNNAGVKTDKIWKSSAVKTAQNAVYQLKPSWIVHSTCWHRVHCFIQLYILKLKNVNTSTSLSAFPIWGICETMLIFKYSIYWSRYTIPHLDPLHPNIREWVELAQSWGWRVCFTTTQLYILLYSYKHIKLCSTCLLQCLKRDLISPVRGQRCAG